MSNKAKIILAALFLLLIAWGIDEFHDYLRVYKAEVAHERRLRAAEEASTIEHQCWAAFPRRGKHYRKCIGEIN